jgi:hypothetical protein
MCQRLRRCQDLMASPILSTPPEDLRMVFASLLHYLIFGRYVLRIGTCALLRSHFSTPKFNGHGQALRIPRSRSFVQHCA